MKKGSPVSINAKISVVIYNLFRLKIGNKNNSKKDYSIGIHLSIIF
jgi:hypothetical protein